MLTKKSVVLVALLLTLRTWVRSRAALQLVLLALRHQLHVLQRSRPRRLRLAQADRRLWVVLSLMLRRVWVKWTDPLIIVKPDTVVGWHRAGFRLYWRLRSRVKIRVGRPRTGQEIRDLIHRMAAERPSPRSKVVGIPRVGGLHHRYEWSQAA